MPTDTKIIFVTGATGQQGGATARALHRDGFHVRAMVRDPASAPAQALHALGIEIVRGDYQDHASLARGVAGAHGVFSIQPSSGQPQYGVTDDDERHFGITLADVAHAAGVTHFVYTSVGGLVQGTGVGHFESKWQIEEHVRRVHPRATIVRPCAFMELLLEPHFELASGTLRFFLLPERTMQFIAAADIGELVARVFADHRAHAGKTIELAGDELSGNAIAAALGRAAGRPIAYARFSESTLDAMPLLRRIVAIVDSGDATGRADIPALRKLHPDLSTLEAWLEQERPLEALFHHDAS